MRTVCQSIAQHSRERGHAGGLRGSAARNRVMNPQSSPACYLTIQAIDPGWGVTGIIRLKSQERHRFMASDADKDRNRVNPYAACEGGAPLQRDGSRLTVPAWIAIACCLVSLGFWLNALAVALPYGHPNAPPLIQIVGFLGAFMVLPALGLFGSIAMLKRERYGMSVIGAAAMMVPIFGPCFGLTLPIGIWALVVLCKSAVRAEFSTPTAGSEISFDNADDAIAAASKLNANGSWDASIAAYRAAGERWPEHATYIENCIADVQRKLDA